MKWVEFERRGEHLLPVDQFTLRLLRYFGVVVVVLANSLLLGILGYHYIQGLAWVDALLNASMILGGMGPVDLPTRTSAKLFASFYALFSGVVFITTAGIMFAPMAHRLLHWFHVENQEEIEKPERDKP
ncbi:MAG TPA: hypothetical protein VGK99_18010 [Acidobacteriota bacterium]|jgi:hypothetical protein